MKLSTFEIVSILLTLGLIAFIIATESGTRERFEKACAEAGGKALSDGRQLQCITKK